MLNHRWFIGLTVIALVASTGCASKHMDFGEPMKTTMKSPTPISEVLADTVQYNGQYLRVSGKVSAVCAKKGCWLRMAGDEGSAEDVFVKFTCPVDGRLIPMKAVGHDVIVEGTLTIEDITEADARHYAEDAGKSPEEIAKIVGSQKRLSMKSPAARVLGMPKE